MGGRQLTNSKSNPHDALAIDSVIYSCTRQLPQSPWPITGTSWHHQQRRAYKTYAKLPLGDTRPQIQGEEPSTYTLRMHVYQHRCNRKAFTVSACQHPARFAASAPQPQLTGRAIQFLQSAWKDTQQHCKLHRGRPQVCKLLRMHCRPIALIPTTICTGCSVVPPPSTGEKLASSHHHSHKSLTSKWCACRRHCSMHYSCSVPALIPYHIYAAKNQQCAADADDALATAFGDKLA